MPIIGEYEKWVAVAPGGFGWCKNPTKTETIGFWYECKEEWDLGKVDECFGHSLICHYICEAALASRDPLAIAACVFCLIDEGLA